MEHFSLSHTTKSKPPRLPFLPIKERVLGRNYQLSLVFIGDTRSKKLNTEYRDKHKPTNVLSFPLSKTEGEIFINTAQAKREAHRFDMNEKEFTAFLFIHAVLHLKGYAHGSRMEKAERELCREFGIC